MELRGLKELLGKLTTFPPGLQTHVGHAFKAGLIEVKTHARDNHPSWENTLGPYFFNPDGTWRYHNISMNLTNSIGLRMRNLPDAIEGDVGVINEFVREDVMEYAGKIERDHPFVGPALEAKKGEWERLCIEAIRNFLR